MSFFVSATQDLMDMCIVLRETLVDWDNQLHKISTNSQIFCPLKVSCYTFFLCFFFVFPFFKRYVVDLCAQSASPCSLESETGQCSTGSSAQRLSRERHNCQFYTDNRLIQVGMAAASSTISLQ